MISLKKFLSIAFSLILIINTISFSFAVGSESEMEVEFVVKYESGGAVEGAEVKVYTLDESTGEYSQLGDTILTPASGRTNDVMIPFDVTFYAVATKDDLTFAASGYSYANIWQTHSNGSISNLDTGSVRSYGYVHLNQGVDEYTIEPEAGDSEPETEVVTEPEPEIEQSIGNTEVEITVYNENRDPITGATVTLYIDGNSYGTDTTDDAGRTDEIMVPLGQQFYAQATDSSGNIYGGTYDYYYNRENYWITNNGNTIENVSTGLSRLPYLHLFPSEMLPDGVTDPESFDPDSYLCGFFPDAVYSTMSPEDCKAIQYVKNAGIFTGTSEGNIELSRPINRAEVTKVMLEAFNIPITSISVSKQFPDVPLTGKWYSNYIYQAQHEGIVGGYPEGDFRPSNTINRVELMRIFLEASKTDYSNVPTTYTFWHDVTVKPSTQWFIAYANYAFFNDLLDNDGNLRASQDMTRLDVIRLLYRNNLED